MKKTFYFSSILLFFFSCNNDGSKIYFRIQNNLGEPISRCYLGSRIRKSGNSYSTKSYAVKWTELKDGELTNYKKTKGKFWGYSDCNLEFYGNNAKYPHGASRNRIDEAIAATNITLIDATMEHPYTKEIIDRKRLPDGKYTLTIEGDHPKIAQAILVSIKKDE